MAPASILPAGPKRNFQVFDPLDFLVQVTQHMPEAGEHLIRNYGFSPGTRDGMTEVEGGRNRVARIGVRKSLWTA